MDIGNKLKTLRINKKIEPLAMAELLNISLNTYRKYERNESAPDIKMLTKIAAIYEMELTELLTEERFVFNQHNKNGSNNGLVNNHFSQKLYDQFGIRLVEKRQNYRSKRRNYKDERSNN